MFAPVAPRRSRAPIARFAGRIVLVAVAVGFVLVTSTPKAAAHAVVVSSSPADNEHLVSAPSEVTIVFSESVSIDLGGLKVLKSDGTRVDSGTTEQPKPTTLRTKLNPGLTDGTYLASYKIVSDDGHAINGAVVFTFGNAGATDVSNLVEKTSPTLDVASKVAQFLTYVGVLLAAGLAFFLAFVHADKDESDEDEGKDESAVPRDDHERVGLVRLARIATLGGGVGVVLTVIVQGALVTSGSLTAVFDLDTLRPVLSQGLGWQSSALLVGLGMVLGSIETRARAAAQSLAFYGGLIATSAFVLWGHATESDNRWVTIPSDVVHVAVAAAWFGGLVGLAATLRRRSREHDDATPRADVLASTAAVVRRFSTLAAVSLLLLIVAGVALAYTQVGSIGALTSSNYGRLVLLKSGLVAVVVAMAGYNRYVVLPPLVGVTASNELHDATDVDSSTGPAEGVGEPEVTPGDLTSTGWHSLLRTVRLEALVIVGVLALTALLVNTTPGTTVADTIDAPLSGPFQEAKPFRDGKVSISITPNRAGYNSFHIDLAGADGKPADLAQKVTLEVKLPAQDLGPIQREMIKGGTGHFVVENVPLLSIPGTWEITLIARVSDFDQERVTFTDTVG